MDCGCGCFLFLDLLLCGWLGEGEGEEEAGGVGVGDGDLAGHGGDDAVDEGEAEAGAAVFARAACVDAVEEVEEAFEVFVVDADAVVGEGECMISVFAACPLQLHAGAARVARGVVDEVEQGVGEQRFVSHDDAVAGYVILEGHVVGYVALYDVFAYALCEVVHVDGDCFYVVPAFL